MGDERTARTRVRTGVGTGLIGACLGVYVFHHPVSILALAANMAPALAGLGLLLLPVALWKRAVRSVGLLAGFALAAIAVQGVRWWGPEPAAAQRGEVETAGCGERLRVVSFNLGTDLASGMGLVNWLRSTDADLIALQELPVLTAEDLEAELSDIYPHMVLFPGGGKGGVRGRGLLSKHPVVSSEYFSLEQERKHLRVRLELPCAAEAGGAAHELEVLVLHLALTIGVVGGLSSGGRDLRSLVDELDPSRPVIVCGDLNTTERSAEWRLLRDVGLTDAFRDVRRSPGYSFPLNGRFRGLPGFLVVRIDYVWHSDALRSAAAELGPDVGSDHLPLVVDLAWR